MQAGVIFLTDGYFINLEIKPNCCMAMNRLKSQITNFSESNVETDQKLLRAWKLALQSMLRSWDVKAGQGHAGRWSISMAMAGSGSKLMPLIASASSCSPSLLPNAA
jgi:hypothetical protein